SDLVAERGFRSVRDPYGGDELLAVPAIHPDVAFVHAWRADGEGNVQLPWPPDHLADVDVLVARAARTTFVSVEEIVSAEVVAAEPERTKLFGFEVDLLVEAPGGARPGALPPLYHEDGEWIAAHRESLGSDLLQNGDTHA